MINMKILTRIAFILSLIIIVISIINLIIGGDKPGLLTLGFMVFVCLSFLKPEAHIFEIQIKDKLIDLSKPALILIILLFIIGLWMTIVEFAQNIKL